MTLSQRTNLICFVMSFVTSMALVKLSSAPLLIAVAFGMVVGIGSAKLYYLTHWWEDDNGY